MIHYLTIRKTSGEELRFVDEPAEDTSCSPTQADFSEVELTVDQHYGLRLVVGDDGRTQATVRTGMAWSAPISFKELVDSLTGR